MDAKLMKDLDFPSYINQDYTDEILFSKTTANTLIQKNPKVAHFYHPKLGNNEKKKTQAMIDGSVIHSLMLDGSDEVVILEFDSYRTNEAKDSKINVEFLGRIPVLRKDLAYYNDLVKESGSQIKEVIPEFYTATASKEVSALYELENGVKSQSRFDWISPEIGLIIDIKTTTDASPEKCEKDIVSFGYDIQEAMYTRAAKELYPGIEWKFLFVFMEKKEPFSVSVIETDLFSKEVGYQKTLRASEQWKACLENDSWPGYGFNVVSCTPWEYKKYAEGE